MAGGESYMGEKCICGGCSNFFGREAWGVAVVEIFLGARDVGCGGCSDFFGRETWGVAVAEIFLGGVRLAIANINTLRYGG